MAATISPTTDAPGSLSLASAFQYGFLTYGSGLYGEVGITALAITTQTLGVLA